MRYNSHITLVSGVQHNECLNICTHCEMITTASLVNILSLCIVTNLFLVMRTFKIYSLRNVPIRNTVGVNYHHHAVHYIPRAYLFLTGSVYLLTFLHHFSPAPCCLWQQPIYLSSASMSLVFLFVFFLRFHI